MLLGRILGNAVCTLKYPGLEGVKLLTVQPLNKRLQPVGRVQVAADVVDAGPGDLVVMVRAREASLALPDVKFVPVGLACGGGGRGGGGGGGPRPPRRPRARRGWFRGTRGPAARPPPRAGRGHPPGLS